jgi:flagellar biosynthesis/type III secretory pathway protein FliH
MGTEPRILKAAGPLAGRRIDGAVFDADRRVREMVAAGEAEARALVAAAQAERAQVLAEAREAGRREGVAAAAALLLRAAAERDRLLAAAPREVAGLALEVAGAILRRAIAEPGAVLALAEAAVSAARGRREVTIRVNPADAAALRAGAGRLAAALGRAPAPVDLREDASVAAGGVVVDTEAGRIDGGVEAQLAALTRALAETAP